MAAGISRRFSRRFLWLFCFAVLLCTFFPGTARANLEQVLFSQGMTLYQNRDFLGAESYFGQVVTTNPQNNQARFYLAVSMAMQGKTAAAIQHLDYLTQVEPHNEAFAQFRNQVIQSQQGPSSSSDGAATTAPGQNTALTRERVGSAIPGIYKEITLGGEDVPLMAHAPPTSPPPTLPSAYQTLHDPLSSADPQVRRDAIRSIIEKKDEKLIPMLMWALRDRPIRELAGRALQNIGEPAIAAVIEFIDKAGNSAEKEFGLITLARFKADKARTMVINTWKKADPALLGPLEKALSEQGQDIIPPMIEALAHEDTLVRLSAATILQRQGEIVIDPLLQLLRSTSAAAPARAQAVAILDIMPRDKVFEQLPEAILIKLAGDSVAEVASFARRMLPSDPDNPTQLPAWRSLPDQ